LFSITPISILFMSDKEQFNSQSTCEGSGFTTEPLIFVVHGIGHQLEHQTLKSFIEGITAEFDFPSTITRAQLASELSIGGEIKVDGVPFALREFNYARLSSDYLHYSEENPRTWIRSFRNRLREINRNRGGPSKLTFINLEEVVDDILFATTIARLVAVRFHFQTDDIQHTALGFLQQIQLYLDYKPYRDDIQLKFQNLMEEVTSVSRGGKRSITLVAHSLGTVVVLRALLNAAVQGKSWVASVDRLITFGSPIDLLFLLYPDFFEGLPNYAGKSIKWGNYSFGNDPIATDLALTRYWIAENCPNLFLRDDPDEIDLGPGLITSAHTDYWHNVEMLHEICGETEVLNTENISKEKTDEAPQKASENNSAITTVGPRRLRRTRSAATVFLYGSMIVGAIVAWLVLVWWEENMKTNDAERKVLIDPIWQLGLWVAVWLMVMFHVKSWSAPGVLMRVAFWVLCMFDTIFLILFLPGLPILGGLPDKSVIGIQHTFFEGEMMQTAGNLILLLIPITAFIGVWSPITQNGKMGRPKKRFIVALLSLATVALSLFVGSRHNPSNVSAEFGILSLVLGMWWLCILLARIHEAFRLFIGGRFHLDMLSNLWRIKKTLRRFRHIGLSR
jgi:hypothetical protein